MSVFGDFRKVWVQRFPGSELPAAWEEDVRANLSKHKQKVAVLKEELEKEEFYVEYLEKLLADVEEHKEGNDSCNSRKSLKNDNAVVTSSPEFDPQHGETKELRETNDKLTKAKDRLSLCEDSANKCISELSVSMNEALLSAEEEDIVVLRHADNNAARQRSNTFSDASNYVTVIEVNGMNLRAAKALSSFESPKSNSNQKVPTKKVPPKPPPKTFQYKPKEDSSSSESTGKKSNDSSLDRKLSEIQVMEEEREKSDTKPEKAEESTDPTNKRETDVEDTRQLVAAAEMIAAAVQGEEDGETGEAVSEAPDSEPLYDQVPMDADGDYVYLATTTTGTGQEKASNESGGSMGSISDLDGETTIKSQASGYSACSSETGTTDTEPGPAVATPPPESPRRSNYVNIDYFIKQRGPNAAGRSHRTDSLESDDDIPPLLRSISSDPEDEEDAIHQDEETFSGMGENKYASSSSLDATPSVTSSAWQWPQVQPKPKTSEAIKDLAGSKAEAERLAMWRCIVSSILESETIFLEGLGVLLQYMKAIRATLSSSQPVISQDDFNTIFYKVPELHALHQTFLEGLKKAQDTDGTMPSVGEHFRIMASQINEYGAFLHNYGRATDTVRKCKQNSSQFAQIMHSIPLRSKGSEQKLSLEDLLHKPVARVQKNALVLYDLLKFTPPTHSDHKALTEALKMNQAFLDEFNIIKTKSMFPSHDRAQRRLVKNSFIVELADGHRKLRHLFLFNDVIACAKYKASGRDKFTFELKWYIALSDIVVLEEFDTEPRENSPANIVLLKSAACTVRDQILLQERVLDEKRPRHRGRAEKQRKKLADLEAQLVLASPNLVFRVGQRSQRHYTFFLSSEFERTQWIDAIHALQTSQLPGPSVTVGMDELQAWITACRTFLKTDMGSYLLRSGRDESLLLGDLHVKVCRLKGLEFPADLAVCLEVDSYGHYFRKARTKLVCGSSTPVWDEEFIIELEGSQNLRVLLYEETGPRPMLRGKATQMLSRSWLGDQRVNRSLTLQGCELELSLRFVPSEVTLRRVPTAKTAGLFGAKIQQVCKSQKRSVPFIITSCVREVERRGMNEIGLYRVSGSASDLTRLKKSFETNSYEAEQLLKEVDVHSVTGVLKLYLRELPEALFTDQLYPRLFDIFNNPTMDGNVKRRHLLMLFYHLPPQNQHIIIFLLAHMSKINQHEPTNKMSLHNLATVFGPTLLRPGSSQNNSRHRDPLAAGTVDVMAQAGILYHFLQSFMMGEIKTPTSQFPETGANPASSALSSLSSSSSMAS